MIFRGCKRDACEVNHTDSEFIGEDMMILELSKMVTYESGFYLLILGLIVLIIAVVLKAKEDITRRKARKNKPAAESVQG